MKAKPFKATPAPNLTGKGPSDTLTRAELVALIASRVPRERGDTDATVRNNVSSKVNYHVGKGNLRQQPSGNFQLGDIGEWARAAYPTTPIRDIPAFPNSGSASLALPALRGTATAYAHPMTLQAAVEEILALRAKIAALSAELTVSHARVQELQEQVQRCRPGWEKRKRKPAR